jgi:hypothetical protein
VYNAHVLGRVFNNRNIKTWPLRCGEMAMGLADDDSKVFKLDESLLNVDEDSMRDDAVRAADAGGDEVQFTDVDGDDALLFDDDNNDMKDDDFYRSNNSNSNNNNNVTNAQSIDMDESAHELLDESTVSLTPIRKPTTTTRSSAVPSPSAVSSTSTPSMMSMRPRSAGGAGAGGAEKSAGTFAAYLGGGALPTTLGSAKHTPASVLRRRTPSSSRVPQPPVMHYSSTAVDRNEQSRLENAEQMQLNLAKVYFDLKVRSFRVSFSALVVFS